MMIIWAAAAEALADFRLYVAWVREPLRKRGIEFREVYAGSFRLRDGNKVVTFHPKHAQPGYYFAAPGKRAHVEYGVAEMPAFSRLPATTSAPISGAPLRSYRNA